MEQIRFTTRVLGTVAAFRLERKEVTQTLRSESCNIITDNLPIAILNGQVSAGDRLEITLDGIIAGHAELLIMDAVNWDGLDIEDARRGGFDSLNDLGKALQRAGFRFKPLNEYHLFRVQFRWLEKVEA